MRLKDKVALVTGAAQGIGAAIASRFAAEGASVFIADLKAAEGQALAEKLERAGRKAWYISLDVTRESDWVEGLGLVSQAAGRLDVLVNNAGVNIRQGIEEMVEPSLDVMLAVNVKGPFFGIKHSLPLMRRGGGGVILNMSSICALIGHRYTPEAYSMVKGALSSLSRSVAVRHAAAGIRSIAVHPSTVETALVQEMLKDPARRAERVGEIPLGRLATVDDVAAACVYLASDEARFVNGVAFPVDGGLTAS